MFCARTASFFIASSSFASLVVLATTLPYKDLPSSMPTALLNQGNLMLQHHLDLDLDQLYRLYWVLQMLGREIILLHINIEDLVVNIIEVKHLLLSEEQPRV